MIQIQSLLNISDNSGGKLGRCIKILHGFKNRWSSYGELVLVSVQTFRKGKKLRFKAQKGEIVQAIILRTKAKHRRKNFHFIKFHEKQTTLSLRN
jgi:large subunit ribosomal protein L14